MSEEKRVEYRGTREQWLNAMAALMAPRYAELGFPLPKFRVSCGWTSSGATTAVNGECWSPQISADGHYEIFLTPVRADSLKVAITLAHELNHAAVGLDQGHKGNFAKVAFALGYVRPLTSSCETEKLREWIAPMIATLGYFPHAEMKYGEIEIREAMRAGRKKALKRTAGVGVVPVSPEPVEGGGDDSGGSEPVTNRPPTQSTRLKKCECPMCGYVVRVTQKWLDVGLPHCPMHGEMEVEQ